MLGIGEYDKNMPDLVGASTDYANLIDVFYNQFKYSVVFYDDNDKLHYCNEKSKKNDNMIKNVKYKLKWTEDDISDFVDSVAKILLTGKHDSLLFFISSHGDSENIIYNIEQRL